MSESVVRYDRSAGVLDLRRLGPAPETRAAMLPLRAERSSVVFRLFILNLLLQVFDGVATYSGLHLGIHEANPLLRFGFAAWGVGPTLLISKANACALLTLVYRIAGEQLAMPALGMLAAVYSLCSLLPWLATFVAVLMRLG